jgi:single-strand DNA-binding protein
MKDLNKVFLLGRLGVDPEFRTTQSGLSFARFSLATARRVRENGAQQAGEQAWTEETQWHRVIAWGKLADAVHRIGKKGQTVLVEGSLRQRKYESKEGKPQISFEVHAEELSFLNSGGGGSAIRAQQREEAESIALEDGEGSESAKSSTSLTPEDVPF